MKEPSAGEWSWKDSEPMRELPDSADEFILGISKLLLPKADITIKMRDGRRFYFDGKGNKDLFLGSVDRSAIQTARGRSRPTPSGPSNGLRAFGSDGSFYPF